MELPLRVVAEGFVGGRDADPYAHPDLIGHIAELFGLLAVESLQVAIFFEATRALVYVVGNGNVPRLTLIKPFGWRQNE